MLKIVSIRSKLNSSRVNLELSDGRIFVLLADEIYILKIHKGDDVDPLFFNKILNSTITLLIRDYALRQVSISPKNRFILLPKLKLQVKKIVNKYSLPTDFDYQSVIDNIIKQLEEKKYLSDSDLGNYLVRRNIKKSSIYIKNILSRAGLNPADFSSILPDNTNQIEEIKRQINKKIKSLSDLKDRNIKQKIIASIFRKGFSLTNINRSIDEMLYNS